MGSATPPPPAGDEYAAVELRGGSAFFSLLFFVACLATRYLVELLPRELYPVPRSVMNAFTAPALAAAGLALGLWAMWRATTPGLARLAVFLNLVALVLSLLLLSVFFLLMPDGPWVPLPTWPG